MNEQEIEKALQHQLYHELRAAIWKIDILTQQLYLICDKHEQAQTYLKKIIGEVHKLLEATERLK